MAFSASVEILNPFRLRSKRSHEVHLHQPYR